MRVCVLHQRGYVMGQSSCSWTPSVPYVPSLQLCSTKPRWPGGPPSFETRLAGRGQWVDCSISLCVNCCCAGWFPHVPPTHDPERSLISHPSESRVKTQQQKHKHWNMITILLEKMAPGFMFVERSCSCVCVSVFSFEVQPLWDTLISPCCGKKVVLKYSVWLTLCPHVWLKLLELQSSHFSLTQHVVQF